MAHIDDTNTQRSNLTYIQSAMDAPMLEKEHEFELARRWRMIRTRMLCMNWWKPMPVWSLPWHRNSAITDCLSAILFRR